MTSASFPIAPVSGFIGAEVDLDLSRPVDEGARQALNDALDRHLVLFFRGQDLDAAGLKRVTEIFAPLVRVPYITPSLEYPDIIAVLKEASEAKIANFGGDWHSDFSFLDEPPGGSVLYGLEIPPFGGDTIWANGGAILRGLPADLRAAIDNLYVVHDFQDALNRAGEIYPLVAHPAIRTHPETGEDIFWINFSLKPRFVDLDKAESDALLARLYDEVKKPEHSVRFRWREGSVAFWDNRAGIHYAVKDYGDFPRVMHRVLIARDDVPHRVRTA